jgi:hypothetical protein
MNPHASEVDCRFVSSRGILKSCDIHSARPHSSINQLVEYNWDALRPGSTVHVCSSAISQFASILEQIPCPIILVTGDADEDVPLQIFASKNDFLTFIENPKIIHWFAQNGVARHPKFSQIPIGLDYHTMAEREGYFFGKQSTPYEQEQLMYEIVKRAPLLASRLQKCYSNFHFWSPVDRMRGLMHADPWLSKVMSAMSENDRARARELISLSAIYYEPERVDRKTTWENQSTYAFVVSPHGNGLDCHRTWEALCLGCIPIVRTSPMDGLFQGLPVHIVQDWSEVTEDNLKKVLTDFSQRTFDLNRLTLSYWMGQINAKKSLIG